MELWNIDTFLCLIKGLDAQWQYTWHFHTMQWFSKHFTGIIYANILGMIAFVILKLQMTKTESLKWLGQLAIKRTAL